MEEIEKRVRARYDDMMEFQRRYYGVFAADASKGWATELESTEKELHIINSTRRKGVDNG
jgi:hypothetical protein